MGQKHVDNSLTSQKNFNVQATVLVLFNLPVRTIVGFMQVSLPIGRSRQRWESFHARGAAHALIPLRHSADWRSLVFLTVLVILFFVPWTGSFRHWWLMPVTCVLAFIACVIKHNHIHCRTFSGRSWNRMFDYLLGLCTGQPTTAIIPVHNERHHAQNHSDQDCVRSTTVNFRKNWLNLILFPIVAVWNVYHVFAMQPGTTSKTHPFSFSPRGSFSSTHTKRTVGCKIFDSLLNWLNPPQARPFSMSAPEQPLFLFAEQDQAW